MFVLDSFALLCLFDRKRNLEHERVRDYLERAERQEIKLLMSKINEGEVFCKLYRYAGAPIAAGFREDLRRGVVPVQIVAASDRRVERASLIKARYPLSYADAFCIELAMDAGAPVVTGDTEFSKVKGLEIAWLSAL